MKRRITRRRLLGSAGALALVAGCTVPARSRTGPRRIGWLTSGVAPPPEGIAELNLGMKEQGFEEGSDHVLHVRAAEDDPGRLAGLARELVALPVDLILATTTGATQAASAATASIPIVMVAAHDPVAAGVVKDLARPGGNVTGQSLMGESVALEQIELLREVARIERIGYVTPHIPAAAEGFQSVTDAFAASFARTASTVGIDVVVMTMRDGILDRVLSMLSSEAIDAVYVIESAAWTRQQIERITAVAVGRRLPSITGLQHLSRWGLLMSYGDARSNGERTRQATKFVARVFRGAKPADLPVELPTRFALWVNLKTAEASGLQLPKTLLDRAEGLIR